MDGNGEDMRAGYEIGFQAGIAAEKDRAIMAGKPKAWNGEPACAKAIRRMPYHKTNNPYCRLPCAPGSSRCKKHAQETE